MFFKLFYFSVLNLTVNFCCLMMVNTYIQTDRQTDTQTHTCIHTYIHAYIHTYIHTYTIFRNALEKFNAPRF